ncbi:thiamine diphosphokinase [Rhodobacteraceae bacterium 2CG4]|uniref:Thiamine diphosphokinase n=1 Tax=Halovulum marinum TaxID=2662447 RepID=A0A6L5Z0P4_9RHOB|nr:thiamine diphosphokinase [Halovulum marinum]MSU90111.1 thiamine diphosphokinase [Halovulum marinum]
MAEILLDSPDNVTLVGGSFAARRQLRRALALAPTLVAADGGIAHALACGHRPVAVIGDMDSLPSDETWRKSDIRVYRLGEQDTTDFEKCLYSIRAPLILGCGFLGGRVDHALASLSALLRYADRPVILLGEQDLTFHWRAELALELAAGTPVSFFPLRRVTGTGSQGLAWTLAGLTLEPGGRVGTSNAATGGTVRAAFDGPGVLATLPLAALEQAAAALSTPAR